jgi:hypothetical protein
MTPALFIDVAVTPGLALLPTAMDTPEARTLLVAIAGQESGLCERHQMGQGTALGFYQCEKLGAVSGVLHGAMSAYAAEACATLAIIPSDVDTVFEAIRLNDALATVIARLVLRMDPKRLPVIGDVGGAWDYYLRCWKPGVPRPATWAANYTAAARAVVG